MLKKKNPKLITPKIPPSSHFLSLLKNRRPPPSLITRIHKTPPPASAESPSLASQTSTPSSPLPPASHASTNATRVFAKRRALPPQKHRVVIKKFGDIIFDFKYNIQN